MDKKNNGSSAFLMELSQVSKTFQDLEILKNLHLKVEKGESIAVLGPSGCGKSTLLHVAGLMDRPTSGRVIMGGQDTSNLAESQLAQIRLNSVGFLFQFHHLLPDFNVLENVMIPNRLAKDDLKSAREKAIENLDLLGLSERLNHRPNQLSGGEQQRVALARALSRNPQILLCDEPTGNLDPHTAEKVIAVIFSEIQKRSVAAIIVTHNPKIAEKADWVYQLREGQLFKQKEKVS